MVPAFPRAMRIADGVVSCILWLSHYNGGDGDAVYAAFRQLPGVHIERKEIMMRFWVKEIKTPSNAYSRPSVHISGPFATHEEADALAQSLTRRGAWNVDGFVIASDVQPAASLMSPVRHRS